MDQERRITEHDQNCYSIELAKADRETFQIDNSTVLLELRPETGLYGAFYTAKGLQWDVWSDEAQEDERQYIAYAVRDPVQAACELLNYHLRRDFQYDPEENEG
jgi:hypothetical protein